MRFPSRRPSQTPWSTTFRLIALNFSLAAAVCRRGQTMPEPSSRAVRSGSYPPSAAHLGPWATFVLQTQPGLRMGKRSQTPKGTPCTGPRLTGPNRDKSSALPRMQPPSTHAGRRTGAACGLACRPHTPLARHSGKWQRTGKDLHPLLSGWNNPPSECCGSWTPDGRYFLFQSQRGGVTNVWAIREGGKSFREGQPRTCAVDDGCYIHFQPGAKH